MFGRADIQLSWRRRAIAAAVVSGSGPATHRVDGGPQMDAVVVRSRVMLEPLRMLDRAVTEALETRSLEQLSEAYAQLTARVEATQAELDAGEDACGGDIALTNLLIITGFALNKLDGEGRYQDWMQGQSLSLLASYHSLAAACATDAGEAKFVSRLAARHIETL